MEAAGVLSARFGDDFAVSEDFFSPKAEKICFSGVLAVSLQEIGTFVQH